MVMLPKLALRYSCTYLSSLFFCHQDPCSGTSGISTLGISFF